MQDAPEPARPPRRPRRRLRFALAAVLVAVLLGIGGQWIGRGDGAPAPGEGALARVDEPRTPADVTPAGPSVAVEPSSAGGVGPLRTPPSPPSPDRTAEPVPAPVAAAAPTAEPAATAAPIEDDRFASLVSLVESRAVSGQFAEARRVLRQLAAMDLAGAQRARVTELATALDDRASSASREILAMAERGEVLAARALASAGLGGETPAFERELANAFAAAGLGQPPSAPPAEDRARWPVPIPLVRERSVVASLATGLVRGTVVDSRSDRVTLRVESQRGLTFPTVPLTACEPVEVGSGEAAELGFAALHAGDPVLARLWLGCARSRLPAAGCPRADRLAELLR